LPKKYTDFKQIARVTKEDINWLNKHFNEIVPEKHSLSKYVFSNIKI
jgi:hypothetical protein